MRLVEIQSRIRGGGAVGGNAWIARIVGPDDKFILRRKFCRYSDECCSNSGASGFRVFYIEDPGVYQFHRIGDWPERHSIGFQVRMGGGFCGFVRVCKNGGLKIIGRFEVSSQRILKLVEKQS